MAEKERKNSNDRSSSSRSNTSVRNESRSEAKNEKKTSGGKNGKRGKESFASQIVPYILLVVALFLTICFITNAFCNPRNELDHGGEGEHIMGYVGYYVCEVTIGFFGYAAFLIPLVLFNLAFFWRRYKEDELIAVKSVLTVLTTIVASALVHVCIHAGDENFSNVFTELYEDGAALYGGGVIGGYVGYALYSIANITGAIFISIVVLIPLVLFLVGTTPQAMMDKIVELVKKSSEDGAKKREKRKKDEEKKRLREEKAARRAKEKEAERLAREAERAERIAAEEAENERKRLEEEEKSASPEDDGERLVLDTELSEPDGEDEPELRLPAFSDGDGEKTLENGCEGKGFTPPEDYGMYDDEEAAERIFPKDGEGEEDDSDCVKFVLGGDKGDENSKYGASRVNDIADELYGEGMKIDTETGEVTELYDDDEELVIPEGIGTEDGTILPAVEEYHFPPLELLEEGTAKYSTSQEEIDNNTRILRETLESFRIKIKEISCSCGPTITRYEIKPDVGVRVRQIANLVDDIALGLAKSGVRIEAPIPGKAAVGVEVPNDKRSTVYLRDIIGAPEFQNHKSKTAACLGADVSGKPVVFDIEKMPHMLIAGTTGSGKSICINSIIMSILYKAKPNEVKLVLIDPKKVEFNVYKDIPHLSCKIVSDPKKAAGALNSAVNEMEKRFELIEEVGVRNIAGYNEITKNDPDKPYMPRMVIIIDELADLMMTAKDDVETAICRIAQKARAAGIHLILGTQRPSVDVITGLIKANVPSRIAFTVMSMVDSRTIIDIGGAEKLTGRGDMLYAPVGSPKPQRVQGSFVSDEEVERIVEYIKQNNPPVVYDSEFEKSIDEEAAKCGNKKSGGGGDDGFKPDSGDEDPKLYDAIELAIDAGKISTSLLQRRLEVGYGRAAKLIDRMEELGYVGPADGNKPRKILITRQELAEKMMNSD